MKCPKCGYLGFETSDRCRNCGYDFSLSVQVPSPAELPLQHTGGAGAPLADFDLARRTPAADSVAALDLDRVIGGDAVAQSEHAEAGAATEPSSRPHPAAAAPTVVNAARLPLFNRPPDEGDDKPLITAPRPARPPLSVRRATPEPARVRARGPRSTPKTPELTFQTGTPEAIASDAAPGTSDSAASSDLVLAAPAFSRLLAAALDVVILGGIDAAVIYFTLAITGLQLSATDLAVIPWIPMAAFLLVLNGGYVVAFTAAAGQTIGKMVTSVSVVRQDGARVTIAGAALRAVGCALSLLTAGAGYLPAFVAADRRALHDRMAGTRVIRIISS
jgi:uncharacterized RDD family membrane protein YckC